MTDKFHGYAKPGQHVTGGLDFYKVVTTLDITPLEYTEPGHYVPSYTAGTYETNFQDTRVVDSQYRLDKLIETISTRAQPIIMGAVVSAAATDDDKKALPSASGNVFSFTFAVEHPDAWEIHGTAPSLSDTINGVLDFVSTVPAAGNNIAITRIVADDDIIYPTPVSTSASTGSDSSTGSTSGSTSGSTGSTSTTGTAGNTGTVNTTTGSTPSTSSTTSGSTTSGSGSTGTTSGSTGSGSGSSASTSSSSK